MLERIRKENDIKRLSFDELCVLPEEIRQFLIEKTSKNGGHLASNLGVVELTIALHRMFELPKDKIIWDVGHQSYTHKLLTGRKDQFDTLRQYGGMSGFPKRKESPCDAFDTGHSSTSVSAGLGYVKARDMRGEDYSVIAVIGDGSLTGGMAYEALNNAAQLETNFIIILNDNDMSISKNVGGMSRYLDRLRTADLYTGLKKGVTRTLERVPVMGEKLIGHIRKTKSSIKQLIVPGMFFEDMGITYLGPIPGHDMKALCKVLGEAKRIDGAVLVHVMTKKGKGYAPAEKAPDKFHGIGPFDIETGEVTAKKKKDTYTDVFGKVIAEGHGVTFAAGLAAGGVKPVFAVYSSFLQRGYDQLVHDVCMQGLPVVFAVDRAGLVGSDGETHQGIFDLSYLGSIPNMTVMSPKNKWELADMVRFAVGFDGPIALRYPRGSAYDGFEEYRAPVELGKSEMIFEEEDIALFCVGHMFEEAVKVRKGLKEEGFGCSLVNARFAKPIDEGRITELSKSHKLIAVIEENSGEGSCAQRVLQYVSERDLLVKVLALSIPDQYVEHGNVETLRKQAGIDAGSMIRKITEAYRQL